MVVHYEHPLYVFTHRDVSVAQISRVTVSRKMKRTFILAFPVRVSRTIQPSFIFNLIRVSSRRDHTSLRRAQAAPE